MTTGRRLIGLLERDQRSLCPRGGRRTPANELVSRGRLLLAQAQLAPKNFAGRIATLKLLEAQKLSPDLDCQRASLLCRAELAAGDLDAALVASTNLFRLRGRKRTPTGWRTVWPCMARLLERMGRWADAAAACQENLTNTAPVERQQRGHLENRRDWRWRRQNLSPMHEAALAEFLAQFTNSPAAGLALLTLGELQLKEYVAQSAGDQPS